MFQWLPFLWQAGGSIDKLDQPEAAAALQYVTDMVQHDIASKDVINQSQYEVTNTFMAGNTAIVQGGPWELPRMSKTAKFEWRLAPLPVKDDKQIKADCLGGYDFVVPKGAGQVDGAFRFIEFMSNPDVLNEGWKSGRIAPREDVRGAESALAASLCDVSRRKWRMPGRADRIRNGRISRGRCRPRSSRRSPARNHRPMH